jgi:hypothetical protein
MDNNNKCTNHWLVKARGMGLNQMLGSSPNGNGVEAWSWKKRVENPEIGGPRVLITEAVAYCSRRTIGNVMSSPDIISVEECTDPEKCYDIPPYYIPPNMHFPVCYNPDSFTTPSSGTL